VDTVLDHLVQSPDLGPIPTLAVQNQCNLVGLAPLLKFLGQSLHQSFYRLPPFGLFALLGKQNLSQILVPVLLPPMGIHLMIPPLEATPLYQTLEHLGRNRMLFLSLLV
jgi:hypothetical protein